METDTTDNAKVELFVSLLARHDRSIEIYVISLCPNLGEAEDILQEVKLFMWRNFDKFTPGTNFLAWAKSIAFYTVLSYRKKKTKQPRLLGDEFLQAVAAEIDNRHEELEKRRKLLSACVKKLGEKEHEVLKLRYTQQLDIEELAEKLGRTVTAVYRHLSRIRQTLHECVAQQEESYGN